MSGGVTELTLAFGAGLATVVSPCVLPMLPIVLGATAGVRDRRKPFYIIVGFIICFCAAALLFGASAQVFGLEAVDLRQLAAAGLMAAGLLMVWPSLAERLLSSPGRWSDVAHRWGNRAGTGPWGGLLFGATLGLLWTPCAGPVLAAILALVAGAPAGDAAPRLFAFALGAALPMLAIAHGGQSVTTRVRALARHAVRIRRGFGVVVIATAMAMLTGQDTLVAARLSALWPAAENPPSESTAMLGETAPEFVGIEAWLNGPALRMSDLRGTVVLVDFWTYGCVNCIRTLPFLKRLYDRHARHGLVVVGVHTPEFAFERSLPGLREAVVRHDIAYPVAQDNRSATWNAFRNRHWPAVYLVDRSGKIIYRHFGEGDEEAIEAQVKAALQR